MRARSCGCTVERRKRRLHGATAFVTEYDEKRRMQVDAGVLQRPHHLRRDHIAGDADDEQLAETGIEHELGGNAGVAAADDRGVGTLSLGQFGEDLLLHGRKPRPSLNESLVAVGQPGQRLCGGIRYADFPTRSHLHCLVLRPRQSQLGHPGLQRRRPESEPLGSSA